MSLKLTLTSKPGFNLSWKYVFCYHCKHFVISLSTPLEVTSICTTILINASRLYYLLLAAFIQQTYMFKIQNCSKGNLENCEQVFFSFWLKFPMMQISLFPLGGYDFSVFFTATLKAVVKAVKAIKAGAKKAACRRRRSALKRTKSSWLETAFGFIQWRLKKIQSLGNLIWFNWFLICVLGSIHGLKIKSVFHNLVHNTEVTRFSTTKLSLKTDFFFMTNV